MNRNIGFDGLGRVTSSSQSTKGITLTFPQYQYNLADEWTSIPAWSQSFGYTDTGSLYFSGGIATPGNDTPQALSALSTTTNRVAGWGYDSAADITSVSSMQRTFTYDAENRQTSAADNGISATYVYDGQGQLAQEYLTQEFTLQRTGCRDGARLFWSGILLGGAEKVRQHRPIQPRGGLLAAAELE